MKIINRLDRFQKCILLFMLAICVVFAVVYPITISKEGIRYKDRFLVAGEENGNATYSGKIKGQTARFVVSADQTVEFHYGDRSYGPYSVKEDPTAIPIDHEYAKYMTGVELREGETILFRGGMFYAGDTLFLYNEDGSSIASSVVPATVNGVTQDQYGNPVDQMKPSIGTILQLIDGPELTHRGQGSVWFAAVFICILNAISICFADQLFYFCMSLRLRNPYDAEPSAWIIVSRKISWVTLSLMALALFIIGLQ